MAAAVESAHSMSFSHTAFQVQGRGHFICYGTSQKYPLSHFETPTFQKCNLYLSQFSKAY